MQGDLKSLKNQIKSNLDHLKEWGVDYVPLVHPHSKIKKVESDQNMKNSVKFKSLSEIKKYIGDCNRCELHQGRTHLVFGEGDENADLMFVGEAPGAEEDKQGRPFVGRSGQLLTKMIEAMGISREDVYIANVVKCRPPQNRNPDFEEIQVCEPFLKSQIKVIKPKVIVTLGKFAAHSLLQTEIPISKLRGEFTDYEGVKLMPTYHPAFLLRNPKMKKLVWQDLQQVMEVMGLK